jgi:hypothetical protein
MPSYKQRNTIERAFGQLRQHRAAATKPSPAGISSAHDLPPKTR